MTSEELDARWPLLTMYPQPVYVLFRHDEGYGAFWTRMEARSVDEAWAYADSAAWAAVESVCFRHWRFNVRCHND